MSCSLIQARVLVTVFLFASIATAQFPDQVGQWGAPFEMGLQTIHSVVLHTGKVLSSQTFGYVLYDPVDHTCYKASTSMWEAPPCVPMTAPVNLYCSGHVQLADGRILFNGGQGLAGVLTTIYDPVVGSTGSWTVLLEESSRRFYPTCTALPDGRILSIAGEYGADAPFTPAIFDPNAVPPTAQWSPLTGARYCRTFFSNKRVDSCVGIAVVWQAPSYRKERS